MNILKQISEQMTKVMMVVKGLKTIIFMLLISKFESKQCK